MKCFETKMTYLHFIKYLIPSVLTMIFLSFYTTIDGFFFGRRSASVATLCGVRPSRSRPISEAVRRMDR